MASDPSQGAKNQAIPSTTAVPDSNTLLAYKLLQDSWGNTDGEPNVFKDLMKNEMKYLVSGISLLQNDPYLQVKLGGVSLNNAGYIANALKQKVAELELEQRIKPSAETLLDQQYSQDNLKSLHPKIASNTITKGEGGILKIGGKKPLDVKHGLLKTQSVNNKGEGTGVFAAYQ